jgi:hypothetical protein
MGQQGVAGEACFMQQNSAAAAGGLATHKISSQLSHFRFWPGGGGVSPKM